jgi:hypothetical protein
MVPCAWKTEKEVVLLNAKRLEVHGDKAVQPIPLLAIGTQLQILVKFM